MSELTQKLRETVEQEEEISRAKAALDKLYELINCGDKRIELSSAKEVLSILGPPADTDSRDTKLEVEIKIV